MRGPNWRHPRGPGSSLQGLWKHPVVHVALRGRRRRTRSGRERRCRRKPSGSSPHAAGSRVRSTRGETSSRPAGSPMCNTLAGRVPMAEPADRRLRVDRSGRLFRAERLRAVRDGGQRLGVDDGLVPGPRQDRARVLHTHNPRGGEQDRSHEPRVPDVQRPAKGDEGRVVSRARRTTAGATGRRRAWRSRWTRRSATSDSAASCVSQALHDNRNRPGRHAGRASCITSTHYVALDARAAKSQVAVANDR